MKNHLRRAIDDPSFLRLLNMQALDEALRRRGSELRENAVLLLAADDISDETWQRRGRAAGQTLSKMRQTRMDLLRCHKAWSEALRGWLGECLSPLRALGVDGSDGPVGGLIEYAADPRSLAAHDGRVAILEIAWAQHAGSEEGRG